MTGPFLREGSIAKRDSEGTAAAALRAGHVSKRYGPVVALDDVSIEIAAGECVALVGESGSGKTTLLRTFNRMVEPDEGRVWIRGRDARALDPVALRRATGYAQQEGGLLPHWSVLRNAALVPWLRGDPSAETRAAETLALVGLPAEEYGRRWPRELSGGQRQRVALARALAARPDVVLLDEPFGALDAITRADLQESFLRLQRDLKVTTLLVTHDLREAILLAHRIAVMRAGRIEHVAPPATLVSQPATAYVRELMTRSHVSAS